MNYRMHSAIRRLPGIVSKPIPKPSPKVTEGKSARAQIGAICKKAGYEKVMLLTDKTLYELGYYKKITESLEKEEIRYTLFFDIASEPTDEIIEKGKAELLAFGAQCVIALGGGSVMDTGKMIAAGGKLKDLSARAMLLKFLFVPGGTLPLITVPSTAGTGAEITYAAMVTNTKHRTKDATVIVGLNITDVILDSELTLDMPRFVTAFSGIDALSHGLEACVADVAVDVHQTENSMECVKTVLKALPTVLEEPHNEKARQDMCRAAFLGGLGINFQLAGYVHAFAHSIGAMYHINHGVAIAMALVPVLRAESRACTEKLAATAVYCGVVPKDEPSESAAEKLLLKIEELISLTGIETKCSHIKPEDYDRLYRLIDGDSINYSAPLIFKREEIIEILTEISG